MKPSHLHSCAATLLCAVGMTSLVSATASGAAISAPQMDNKAYVLMDYDSGQILSESNAEQALPPASLTKMMTSYIVEQALKSGRLKPTDQVHVSLNAWCHGSSTESCMYLPLNGQASVMDILRGIIVQSGNDASKAIAEHLAGSEAAFAQQMNDQAKRLGMTHTHFANPTGLPASDHRSSAHDLALLARAIIRDSAAYYPIYSEREFKYNGIKQGNRNALLYTDSTVDGLKTGHTNEAGYCLTASAKRDNMRLISVLMGASSMQARADQTRTLFNWGFNAFEKVTLAKSGAAIATVAIDFGQVDTVQAGLPSDWAAVIPRGKAGHVQTKVALSPTVSAPITKGAVLGKVTATLDGTPLAEQPLIAMASVEQAGMLKRAWQHARKLFK
jgi:D-alanyl-D-alanine carboxypeptidase (penicillin-binding protein 5/6)